jgi:beta-lactamase superfamily II metal-dependent hydrolase
MFKIHTLQAAFGDSLILQFGTATKKRWVLIDGGPEGTYGGSLRKELKAIADGGGAIERVILSHVDGDHIVGLLELFSELRQQSAPIKVAELWHNSFAKTIGDGTDVQARFQAMVASVAGANTIMANSADEVNTIEDGNKLRLDALALTMPTNTGFQDGLVSLDTSPGVLTWGNLKVTIVGPTKANLDALKEEWIEWLDEHEDDASGDPMVAAMADVSKPNLSSIQIHVKDDKGNTALFTGDGRGDHLLQGLKQAKLLNAKGAIHVNVLKLPHHGSDRNVTKTFFKKVTADHYIACANGKDGNPDLSTLRWLVQAAMDDKRKITIHCTNQTKSTDDLLDEFNPKKSGYTLKFRPTTKRSMTLTLS